MCQINMIKRGLGEHIVKYYNSDSILILHSSNMHTVPTAKDIQWQMC